MKRVEDRDEARDVARWYALRTRGRAEKQAGARLEALGIDVFTATAALERRWSDRVKRVPMPLFPGYIFARFALADAVRTLAVPGVVEVVRTAGRATPLRDEELEAVRRLAAGVEETGELPEPADVLEPGLAVRVTGGPFRGLTGVLLHREGGDRVAVRIGAIRQARAVRMERGLVVPLPGATPVLFDVAKPGAGFGLTPRQVALAR